jgi:hypothetical protein
MIEDDDNWGKLLIHPPQHSRAILSAEPSSSKLRELGEGNSGLSTKHFFHTRRVLLHAVKSYDMGPPAFPSERRCAAGFYCP